MTGVLAVHAHPDDETLSTGALLATASAAGRGAVVVTCTRGERGEVLALPGTTSQGLAALEGDGPALAAHREVELTAALTALGAGVPTFLDELSDPRRGAAPAGTDRFEDSGMVWVRPGLAGPDPAVPGGFSLRPLDDGAARLAGLVRRLRPDVVATYEAGGGYGHPDHVRAHQVTVQALHLAADPALEGGGEPWAAELWQRVAPASTLRAERAALAADPAVRALAAEAGLTFPDPDDALPALARDDALLAAADDAGHLRTVDVAPVLGPVLDAMRAHATQVQHAWAAPAGSALAAAGVLGWYALSNGVLAPVGAQEVYLVTTPTGRRPTSVGSGA